MTTLLEAQKTLNAAPVVNLTVGAVALGAYLARYKYQEKHGGAGRVALWLDNAGGTFDDLGDFPSIARGAECVLTRGLRVDNEDLTAAMPTVWVESLMYVYQQEQPYLVLDCIDWVKRLQYYRYATEQTWTGQLIEVIVAAILGEVGLTLASGAWSTALSIDYIISPSKSAWTALQELLSKVPEKLYAKPGKEIGWKALDVTEVASYDYGYNSTVTHPLLPKTSEAESSPRYNWIKVRSDADETYSGTASDAAEIALCGYRRRTITDRALTSSAECLSRAEAELEVWSAKSTAGVVVARPHFTVRLFDVISAPAPLWGGRPIGSGSVTRIIEWYNYPNRPYEQALTIGELPDAAVLLLGEDEGELPVDPELPTDPPDPPDPPPTTEDDLDDGSVTTPKLADGAVTAIKANIKLDDLATPDDNTDLDVSAARHGLAPKLPNDGTKFLSGLGIYSVPAGVGGGEANDGQNVGTAGVGVYKDKSGVTLRFKKINAGSSKVTVTDDPANDEVDIDIAEANLTLGNIGGTIGTAQIASSAVATAKIASNAVTTTKLDGGAVTPAKMSRFPKAKVYLSNAGSQTVEAGNNEAIAFDAEEIDTDAIHSTSINPSRLTCKTAGDYLAGFRLCITGAEGEKTYITFKKNGTVIYSAYLSEMSYVLGTGSGVASFNTLLDLAVNDYIEVFVYNIGAAELSVDGSDTEEISMLFMTLIP